MTGKAYWMNLPSKAFHDYAVREDAIAVLPIAAIEQHGLHLSVGVDTQIAEGMIAAVHDALPADTPVVFLPVQAIGKSNEHINFPGTLTIGTETLFQYWMDLVAGIHRAGFRKLLIINSHGGNVELMGLIARDARAQFNMLVVGTNWLRFGQPAGLFSDDELAYGIHAGAIETSLMLAMRPDCVDLTVLQDYHSKQADHAADYAYLRAYGKQFYGWLMDDLNPDGAVGDARAASAEKGAASQAHAVAGVLALLDDMARFPRADFDRS